MPYFDFNATMPLNASGRRALLEGIDSSWLNPSSPYLPSAKVHIQLEAVREGLADRLGYPSANLVFTGGATEGNNAIIQHLHGIYP